MICVKNNSGVTIAAFGVLAITGQTPINLPSTDLELFQDEATFMGIAPVGSGENFVVLQQPLAAASIGKAVAEGVVQVQINVTNTDHAYATTEAAHTDRLTSQAAAAGGVPILWKESGTGLKWAQVLLPKLLNVGVASTGVTNLTRSTAQTIPTGVSGTTITWDASSFNTTPFYDGSHNDRFVFPVTRDVLFILNVLWQTNATGFRGIGAIAASGPVILAEQLFNAISETQTLQSLSVIYNGQSGYLYFSAAQGSGGDLLVSPTRCSICPLN